MRPSQNIWTLSILVKPGVKFSLSQFLILCLIFLKFVLIIWFILNLCTHMIMSYSMCWNWRWILKFSSNFESLFSFNFQLKKKLRLNFAFWGTFKLLRCINSKKIKLQSSITVICTSFRSDFFQRKIKRKQRFKIWQNFQYSTPISTLRICLGSKKIQHEMNLQI